MNWKGKSDSSLSQYVTFDVKHICKVSFLNIPQSKVTTGKKHFLIQSMTDNSQTGKVRVTVLSHNMLPLMWNISVKFHSDIMNSKGITGQKPFFQYEKGQKLR